MRELTESIHLLYAQLLTQCLHGAAPSGRGLSFVSKQIKGSKHWYLQLTVGSRKTQHYLGPDSPETRSLVEQEKSLWDKAVPDLVARENLVAMLLSGGAAGVSAVEARVFELLERAGIFLVGGVLVGSHAFSIYGNMLGVRWASETTRTHDMDVAMDYRVLIGIRDHKVNLRQVLAESEMGFLEVPALDRKAPSTKFRIKGRQLSVDLLTPLLGRPAAKPVHLDALNTYAEPVRFLDYLLEDTQPAVIVARAGILVNVPAPGRYALHKLVTAERRIAALQTKRTKDLQQAEQLITVLLRNRPADLRVASRAVSKQPVKFRQQMQAGIARLKKDTQAELKAVIAKSEA